LPYRAWRRSSAVYRRSDREDFYGEERLEKFLADRPAANAIRMVSELHADVQEFAEGMPQADDITVVALRYLRDQRA
jgi:serine phosphatase RsbU (regulator of sigma subunit)